MKAVSVDCSASNSTSSGLIKGLGLLALLIFLGWLVWKHWYQTKVKTKNALVTDDCCGSKKLDAPTAGLLTIDSSTVPQITRAPVIIVGGGLTGLILAYQLQKAGIPFKILESNPHVGGRVATVRYPNGETSEAPLEEYWARSPTVPLAKELGILMHKDAAHSSVIIDGKIRVAKGDPDFDQYSDSMFGTSPEGARDKEVFRRWNEKVWKDYAEIVCGQSGGPASGVKGELAPLMEQTPDRFAPNHDVDSWTEEQIRRAEPLKRISLADYVKSARLPHAVEEWIRIHLEPEIATEWDTIPALDGLEELRLFLNNYQGFGESNYHIKGGNTQFIRALLSKLPRESILLNCSVTHISDPASAAVQEVIDTNRRRDQRAKVMEAQSDIGAAFPQGRGVAGARAGHPGHVAGSALGEGSDYFTIDHDGKLDYSRAPSTLKHIGESIAKDDLIKMPIVTYVQGATGCPSGPSGPSGADVRNVVNVVASYVVLTVPIHQLAHIRFQPPLDEKRQMALHTARTGSYIKVHLRFRKEAERFWQPYGDTLFTLLTDKVIGAIYDSSGEVPSAPYSDTRDVGSDGSDGSQWPHVYKRTDDVKGKLAGCASCTGGGRMVDGNDRTLFAPMTVPPGVSINTPDNIHAARARGEMYSQVYEQSKAAESGGHVQLTVLVHGKMAKELCQLDDSQIQTYVTARFNSLFPGAMDYLDEVEVFPFPKAVAYWDVKLGRSRFDDLAVHLRKPFGAGKRIFIGGDQTYGSHSEGAAISAMTISKDIIKRYRL
jgi:hypothetical protein